MAEGPARSAALAAVGIAAEPRSIETGLWLAPVAACVIGDLTAGDRSPTLSAEDYLTLVDATGRWLRAGKRGGIPPELAPILARLDLEVEDWIGTMCGWRQMLGSAVGGATSRAALAAARGLRWVQNRCRLFAA